MSSTTTRPPRTPGALVADAVAELADVTARLAELTRDGALVEVPAAALAELTETMHRAGDRVAAVSLLCVKHHHAVHEGGWTITRTDGIDPHATGCWTFTPPRTRP